MDSFIDNKNALQIHFAIVGFHYEILVEDSSFAEFYIPEKDFTVYVNERGAFKKNGDEINLNYTSIFNRFENMF
jgi:hypothetical protein